MYCFLLIVKTCFSFFMLSKIRFNIKKKYASNDDLYNLVAVLSFDNQTAVYVIEVNGN